MRRALGRLRRELERELTCRVLVAAMLIPFVEATFGWRAHTPLGVPLLVHGVALAAIVLLVWVAGPRGRSDANVPRAAHWLPVPLVAVILAVVLNSRSNIFYTAHTLIEGMTLLLLVHVAGRLLRSRALASREADHVRGVVQYDARRRAWGAFGTDASAAPPLPAVRLADALTAIVGWTLLASWMLIALEHRHPVGPILIVAGVVECVALVVLIPDVLPHARWRASLRRRFAGDETAGLRLLRGGGKPALRFGGLRRRKTSSPASSPRSATK